MHATRTWATRDVTMQTRDLTMQTESGLSDSMCCSCAVQASIAANTYVISGPSQTKSEWALWVWE